MSRAYAELRDGLRARGLRTAAAGRRAGAGGDRGRRRLGHRGRRHRRRRRLSSTLAAARAGKRLLLANKESLVLAGALLMRTAPRHGAQILPIDSEHNAIFQCLPADGNRGRRAPHAADRLGRSVPRPLPAVAGDGHARRRRARIRNGSWDRKISVDSATLMNKGLEVIEAHHLFGLPADAHRGAGASAEPGAFAGRLRRRFGAGAAGHPGHAHRAGRTAWPGRSGSTPASRRWTCCPGAARFRTAGPRGLSLPGPGLRRLAAGGTAPAMLNAANEVAVAAFLEGRLSFLGIPDLVEATLVRVAGGTCRRS